jgi:hypothetical protein
MSLEALLDVLQWMWMYRQGRQVLIEAVAGECFPNLDNKTSRYLMHEGYWQQI